MGDRGPTDVSVDPPAPDSPNVVPMTSDFHPSGCVIAQTNCPHSIAAAASLLARPVDFGVHHSHMPGQCIIARESLFFGAQMTADLLLAGIVDRVFVPCQIVGSREDRIAWLSCRRIDPFALVWASLGVARRCVTGDQVATRGGLSMGFALVLLKLGRCLKS